MAEENAQNLLHEIFGDSDDEEPIEAKAPDAPAEPPSDPIGLRGRTEGEVLRDTGLYSDSDVELEAPAAGGEGGEAEEQPKGRWFREDGGAGPGSYEVPLADNPEGASLAMARVGGAQRGTLRFEMRPFHPVDVLGGGESDGEGGEGGGREGDGHHAVVRWRAVEGGEGGPKLESNARIVTWSDGTRQLLVGEEAFDIVEQDTSLDHHYLFAQHAGMLQAQAHLGRRMQFRPAAAGRAVGAVLNAAVGKKKSKGSTVVRQAMPTVDPEREKERELRVLEEGYRKMDRQNKRQQKAARAALGSERQGRRVLTRDFLEANDNMDYLEYGDEYEEDEEEGGGARRGGARGRGGSDDERQAEEKINQAKRRRVALDDEGGREDDFVVDDLGGGEGAEISEDSEDAKPRGGRGARRGLVVSDDEDD